MLLLLKSEFKGLDYVEKVEDRGTENVNELFLKAL